MKVKTSEAIAMANDGKSLKDIILEDINDVQVNIRDAMSLSRQGIVVPEANMFYDDSDIEYDEEIDGLERIGELRKMSWEEKEAFFAGEEENEIYIKIRIPNSRMKSWIDKNSMRIADVLEPILLSLYNAEEKLKKTFTQHINHDKPPVQ
jgi:hypothetical protein